MQDIAISRIFEAAANDRRRGATEIESELISSLLEVDLIGRRQALHDGGAALFKEQPAMANLRNLAAAARSGSVERFVAWLQWRLEILARLPDLLASAAWPLVRGSSRVVTISRSSAVAAVIEGAWGSGWQGAAVVLDGGAPGCGFDQARRLAKKGRARGEEDHTAHRWLAVDGTIVVIGADAVGGTSFINVRGTRTLLESARDRGIQCFLVADSGKSLGEHELDEVVQASATSVAGNDGTACFEVVELSTLSARIDETGVSVC